MEPARWSGDEAGAPLEAHFLAQRFHVSPFLDSSGTLHYIPASIATSDRYRCALWLVSAQEGTGRVATRGGLVSAMLLRCGTRMLFFMHASVIWGWGAGNTREARGVVLSVLVLQTTSRKWRRLNGAQGPCEALLLLLSAPSHPTHRRRQGPPKAGLELRSHHRAGALASPCTLQL